MTPDPKPERRLIVNADDWGYARGVTRGIAEAQQRGIVRSTTVMVNRVHADDVALALGLASGVAPGLSLGLHLELDAVERRAEPLLAAVREQLARFGDLFGRAPSHMDSHHHLHLDPVVLQVVAEAAGEAGLPVRSPTPQARAFLRERGVATHDAFLGGPEPTVTWTVDLLLEAVRTVAGGPPGVTELCCHPGYVSEDLRSSYREARQDELAALTDPRVREALQQAGRDAGVVLTGWGEA